MQKVKLTAVYHNEKDRNGNAYVSKQGKPYTKCNIKCAEYGDKYLSGFGNQTTRGWNVGDEVEIEIEQRGEYFNFSVPKKEAGISSMDKETLLRIEKKIDSVNWHIVEFLKSQKSGRPMYPSAEMEGIEPELSGVIPEDQPTEIEQPW